MLYENDKFLSVAFSFCKAPFKVFRGPQQLASRICILGLITAVAGPKEVPSVCKTLADYKGMGSGQKALSESFLNLVQFPDTLFS